MHSATTKRRNTVCISCVSSQGCLQSNVSLMAFKRGSKFSSSRGIAHWEDVHPCITWSTHKRHPVLVHGLTKSKGNHPVMTLRPPSNTKQCLFVPFMLFIQRQLQFIHFEVLWKQEPKGVILWHRTSAKSFQLVQADILRPCFSSIKVSSDDLLYNTGRRRLFSHRVGSWGVLKQMQQPGAPAPGLPIAPIAHFQQGIPSHPLYAGRAAQVQPQPTSSAFFRRMKSKFTWLFMP